jgi:hypothetical protein
MKGNCRVTDAETSRSVFVPLSVNWLAVFVVLHSVDASMVSITLWQYDGHDGELIAVAVNSLPKAF